jgi:DNA-binding MarR family transcriptional regulator
MIMPAGIPTPTPKMVPIDQINPYTLRRMMLADAKAAGQSPKLPRNADDEPRPNMRREQMRDLLVEHGPMTTRQMADLMGVTTSILTHAARRGISLDLFKRSKVSGNYVYRVAA